MRCLIIFILLSGISCTKLKVENPKPIEWLLTGSLLPVNPYSYFCICTDSGVIFKTNNTERFIIKR